MRIAVALICLMACGVSAASPASALSVPDRKMDAYFSVWTDNAAITLATVSQFYAHRAVYYGRSMSADAIYRDKLAYVRRWPRRRYDVVPGSVAKTCDAAESHCRVTAILRWQRSDAAGRAASRGASTITLDLAREDGELKIVRESGSPVARSDCTIRGCSGFR